MENLFVHNTLTRKKEKFEPISPGMVGIYVCGPTVYDHSHVGHAKSYISFDVIVRYLRYLGYQVKYVQNITDVGHLLGDAQEGEDRVAQKARLEQTDPMQIVENFARSFFEDMDLLGNIRPDISPRASGHILEQIEIITILVQKGFAYETEGNVYFDVHKFSGYGKLSGRKIEELESGVRVGVAADKKHPADFALWKKASPEHLMQWNSPWGRGYPGWHIECSCMSTKYLGKSFDIHGGGLENIFPHHECEIAQSEGAYDKPFVKYWLHNNMVTVDGVKMGKSLHNFVTIKDAVRQYEPLAIRYFILMSHYRSALDFSDKALDAAATGLKKIHHFQGRIGQTLQSAKDIDSDLLPLEKFESNFKSAMNDDFNTPQALAAVFELINEVNKVLDNLEQKPGKNEILRLKEVMQRTLGDVLGILPQEGTAVNSNEEDFERLMEIVMEIRGELRGEKNFKLSDKIRDGLAAMGITLKDTAEGPAWLKDL
jgi:cysteinyl-tRNA synthetase